MPAQECKGVINLQSSNSHDARLLGHHFLEFEELGFASAESADLQVPPPVSRFSHRLWV